MYRAPYTQSISRQNKACFLFLLDQSFSMEEPLGNSSNRKCDELVAAINGWLQNMAIRASGDEGIKDWMDIGVFGYRTDQQANPIIESALQGPLAGRVLCSISEIGSNPARIDETAISWRDAKDGWRYTLDRKSGALTVILASATGGNFLFDRCRLPD